MKRKITFDVAVIDGEIVREICEIIPELEYNFTKRKSYWEYYYKEMTVDLTLEQIESISDKYSVEIDGVCLIINVD
jgi:hypothetical protein